MAVLALSGCGKASTASSRLQKTAEHLRISMKFLHRYCDSDPLGAEQALLEWEAYAKKLPRDRIQPSAKESELASIYARLYLVNKHLGRAEAAEAYLQKAFDLRQQVATAERSSPVSRELMLLWADSQLDWNFDVKWKTQPK